jgi:hypothetical protein
MADPTIKRIKIEVGYTGSDGYRQTLTCKGGAGTCRKSTGDEVPPEAALFAAIDELSRFAALFGFADEAALRFNAARHRVEEWQAARLTPTPKG